MMNWLEIAHSLGIPVMCLVGLSLAVWRALQFVGERVLQPLAERHLKFIDQISECVEKQTLTMASMIEPQTQAMERLDKISDRLSEIANGIGEVRQLVVRTANVTVVTPEKKVSHDPGSGG